MKVNSIFPNAVAWIYSSLALYVWLIPCVAAADDISMSVGVIAPLSGDFVRYGQRIREGVLSSSIRKEFLLFEDEGCEARKAVAAYEYLHATKGVRVFIGPFCGSPQVVVAQHVRDDKAVAVIGSSAPRKVFEISDRRVYSSQYSIETESEFNADQLNRMGIRRVLLVIDENDFSRTHEEAFKKRYQGQILDTLVSSSGNMEQMRAFAMRIKSLKPDAVYVPDAYPLLVGLIRELNRIGLGALPVFSIYAAQSSDIIDASGGNADQLVYSFPENVGQDAISYFSKTAADILEEAKQGCQDAECVLAHLRADRRFDDYGVLAGKLILKTVRGRDFVDYVK